MKCMGHKSIEKKEDPKFTIWIEKTRLIKCLLHGLLFGGTKNKCRIHDFVGVNKGSFYWLMKKQ